MRWITESSTPRRFRDSDSTPSPCGTHAIHAKTPQHVLARLSFPADYDAVFERELDRAYKSR
jgi:hypothetical protein